MRTCRTHPSHWCVIAVRLERLSKDVFSVEEGSLYPALYRMESRGWLATKWALTDTGRALFRRDATLDEIREELHWHVQMRTEERNALLVLASASLLAV